MSVQSLNLKRNYTGYFAYALLIASLFAGHFVAGQNNQRKKRKNTTSFVAKIKRYATPLNIGAGLGVVAVAIVAVLLGHRYFKKKNPPTLSEYDKIKKQVEEDFFGDPEKELEKTEEFKKKVLNILEAEKKDIIKFVQIYKKIDGESLYNRTVDAIHNFTIYFRNRKTIAKVIDDCIVNNKDLLGLSAALNAGLKDEVKKLKGNIEFANKEAYDSIKLVVNRVEGKERLKQLTSIIGDFYANLVTGFKFAERKGKIYVFFANAFGKDACFADQGNEVNKVVTTIDTPFYDIKRQEKEHMDRRNAWSILDKTTFMPAGVALEGFIEKYFLVLFQRIFLHYQREVGKKMFPFLNKYPQLQDASLIPDDTGVTNEIEKDEQLNRKFKEIRDKYFYTYLVNEIPPVVITMKGDKFLVEAAGGDHKAIMERLNEGITENDIQEVLQKLGIPTKKVSKKEYDAFVEGRATGIELDRAKTK